MVFKHNTTHHNTTLHSTPLHTKTHTAHTYLQATAVAPEHDRDVPEELSRHYTALDRLVIRLVFPVLIQLVLLRFNICEDIIVIVIVIVIMIMIMIIIMIMIMTVSVIIRIVLVIVP